LTVNELLQQKWMLRDSVVGPRCKLKLTNFAYVKVVTQRYLK